MIPVYYAFSYTSELGTYVDGIKEYKVKKIIVIYRALLAFLFRRYDKKAFQNRFDIHVRYKK